MTAATLRGADAAATAASTAARSAGARSRASPVRPSSLSARTTRAGTPSKRQTAPHRGPGAASAHPGPQLRGAVLAQRDVGLVAPRTRDGQDQRQGLGERGAQRRAEPIDAVHPATVASGDSRRCAAAARSCEGRGRPTGGRLRSGVGFCGDARAWPAEALRCPPRRVCGLRSARHLACASRSCRLAGATGAPVASERSGADCRSTASPATGRPRAQGGRAHRPRTRPRAGARAVEQRRSSGSAARAVIVVPMPTSRAAFRRRGYRVADLVARRAGLRCARLLRSRVARPTSAASTGDAPPRNVAGAFDARDAAGRRVIVLDDVVTTGATLEEAVRALRAAGPTCSARPPSPRRRAATGGVNAFETHR